MSSTPADSKPLKKGVMVGDSRRTEDELVWRSGWWNTGRCGHVLGVERGGTSRGVCREETDALPRTTALRRAKELRLVPSSPRAGKTHTKHHFQPHRSPPGVNFYPATYRAAGHQMQISILLSIVKRSGFVFLDWLVHHGKGEGSGGDNYKVAGLAAGGVIPVLFGGPQTAGNVSFVIG